MVADLVLKSLVGDSVSPTIDNRKQIAPAVLAAIIGGVATVGSGIASLASQADANKANKDIAEANREWQSEENRKAEQWSDQMWQKQFDLTNQYNTPSAMRARLEEGGYNPFLFDGSSLGSASGSASMGTVPSPSRTSAPSSPTMQPLDMSFIDRGAQNAISNYYQATAINAQSANQDAQADYYRSVAAKNVYDIYGKEAAQEYGKKIGYDVNNSPTMRLAELEIANKELVNKRASLENDLIDKYGSKKAESEIANIEQLTTKYVAEIGMMASNRALNERQMEALGAQMARDYAQARLFTSDAKINEGIYGFAIEKFRSEANYALFNAGNAAIGFSENYSDYLSRSRVRSYKISDESRSRQLWNYQQSPEANYVNAFINGFTSNLNGVVGVNVNSSYSRSKVQSGSVSTSTNFYKQLP